MNRELISWDELEALVTEIGFLPFFKNEIPGFSVDEHTPPQLWFSDEEEGPWDWKGPVARGGKCLYGKLFRGKAGFISLEWLPDLANYRRGGYDFDARYDDGLVSHKDKQVYDMLAQHGSLLSGELKTLCGYGKQGLKGFDTVITRLQMQTYVSIMDFEYMVNSRGEAYGWGIGRYTTPEAHLDPGAVTSAYHRSPKESLERMTAHLERLLPRADRKQIMKILR